MPYHHPYTAPPHVRWGIARDVPEVLTIEAASPLTQWSHADFMNALRRRDTIMLVCDTGDRVTGFTVYQLHDSHLELLNFGVHPEHRRKGYGRALVDRIKYKVCSHKRTRVIADVWEGETASHLFARAMRFRATGVEGDCYRFEWRPTPAEREAHGYPLPTARPVT